MTAGKAGDWNEKLDIPGRVRFMEGVGDLPMVNVTTEWSTAEIYLHGAHVTHFQKKQEPPLLFLSRVSRFEGGHPIRGGVPVILPWFGNRAGLPAHGFARISLWDLHEITIARDGGVRLHFRLVSDGGAWGFPPFTADYFVSVRETLDLRLSVTNNDPKEELVLEECLHAYLATGDIGAVSITGLNGLLYQDKADNFVEKTDDARAITITDELDRIYLNAPGPVEVRDASFKRVIHVQKEHSASTVIWNPWIARAQQLADLGDDEYRNMVCVEGGNVGKNRLTLAPGKSSGLVVRFSTTPLAT